MPFPFTIIRCSLFQSTHPRGVRPRNSGAHVPCLLFQSTHPRGVRLDIADFLQLQGCFNPRTHEGCDSRSSVMGLTKLKFQSTHPRGVRHVTTGRARCQSCFNPRTHEGCDPDKVFSYQELLVSIHAPTRGATV